MLWRVEKGAEQGWIRRFPDSPEGPDKLEADQFKVTSNLCMAL